MPIKIPGKLPAVKVLRSENIFVMTDKRAERQDIRPLKILILNIMPTKIVTETQLLRLLGNSPIQVEFDLIQTVSHISKNTSSEHLERFYKSFADVKNDNYDGMIITGAPVETLPYDEVEYWDEICEIMEWSKTHVTSTFHICWGAQAGLYYHYGIEKEPLPKKLSGVFLHKTRAKNVKLLRGFDDYFFAPHSRHTTVSKEKIAACPELKILADSDEAGVYLVISKKGKHIFVFGHCEYDADTLANEYFRDKEKGLNPEIPTNYFPSDDPKKQPKMTWRAHAALLFNNWINYYLYQETPYDLNQIGDAKIGKN